MSPVNKYNNSYQVREELKLVGVFKDGQLSGAIDKNVGTMPVAAAGQFLDLVFGDFMNFIVVAHGPLFFIKTDPSNVMATVTAASFMGDDGIELIEAAVVRANVTFKMGWRVLDLGF